MTRGPKMHQPAKPIEVSEACLLGKQNLPSKTQWRILEMKVQTGIKRTTRPPRKTYMKVYSALVAVLFIGAVGCAGNRSFIYGHWQGLGKDGFPKNLISFDEVNYTYEFGRCPYTRENLTMTIVCPGNAPLTLEVREMGSDHLVLISQGVTVRFRRLTRLEANQYRASSYGRKGDCGYPCSRENN